MSFYNLAETEEIRRVLKAETPEEITTADKLEALRQAKALFVHPGENHPNVPHPILSSGNCSNGYINSMMLFLWPRLLEAILLQLANQIKKELGELGNQKTYVCGPALGAIMPAFLLAKHLGNNYIPMFAEKNKFGDGMVLERFPLSSEDLIKIIVAEDVTSTGTSALSALNAVTMDGRKQAEVLCLATIIDRRTPNHKLPPSLKVISWLDHRRDGFQTYKLSDCPLCNAGSQRLPPKSNWDKFFL